MKNSIILSLLFSFFGTTYAGASVLVHPNCTIKNNQDLTSWQKQILEEKNYSLYTVHVGSSDPVRQLYWDLPRGFLSIEFTTTLQATCSNSEDSCFEYRRAGSFYNTQYGYNAVGSMSPLSMLSTTDGSLSSVSRISGHKSFQGKAASDRRALRRATRRASMGQLRFDNGFISELPRCVIQ